MVDRVERMGRYFANYAAFIDCVDVVAKKANLRVSPKFQCDMDSEVYLAIFADGTVIISRPSDVDIGRGLLTATIRWNGRNHQSVARLSIGQ